MMKDMLLEFEKTIDRFLKNNDYKSSLKHCSHDKFSDNFDYCIYFTFYKENKQLTACNTFEEDKSKENSKTSYLTFLLTTETNNESPSTLTELRVQLTERILSQVLMSGGATVTRNSENENIFKHLHLSNRLLKATRNLLKNEDFSLISIAPVSNCNISPDDYKKSRKEALLIKGEETNSSLGSEELEHLCDAVVLFDLLKSKISKPVKSTEHCDQDRGAVFVFYNYVRLKIILDLFEEKSSNGIYPKLPELQEIDVSCLTYQEEWRLIYDHVLVWPSLLLNILRSLNNKDDNCRIHSIINFLQNLSFAISSYYSKVQILTQPREQLLKFLFARIYLLKVVMLVMSNCFTILGIKPLSHM
ncbi:DALR anticodon-binding domain-containing protein 3 isoform X3 [Lycorma delicatula]|uniref:DALR anticodon-binding domain-containing protein 3 isoform X3 n=1 Tax=Lycorma delicatula TaxID=130591 RepID=UPI003F5190F2